MAGSHPHLDFSRLQKPPDIASSDAPDDLGQGGACPLAPLPHATQEGAHVFALLRKQPLVVLRLQTPGEAPLFGVYRLHFLRIYYIGQYLLPGLPRYVHVKIFGFLNGMWRASTLKWKAVVLI